MRLRRAARSASTAAAASAAAFASSSAILAHLASHSAERVSMWKSIWHLRRIKVSTLALLARLLPPFFWDAWW